MKYALNSIYLNCLQWRGKGMANCDYARVANYVGTENTIYVTTVVNKSG